MRVEEVPDFRPTKPGCIKKQQDRRCDRNDMMGGDLAGYSIGMKVLKNGNLVDGLVMLCRPLGKRISDKWQGLIFLLGVGLTLLFGFVFVFQIVAFLMTINDYLPTVSRYVTIPVLTFVVLILVHRAKRSIQKIKID